MSDRLQDASLIALGLLALLVLPWWLGLLVGGASVALGLLNMYGVRELSIDLRFRATYWQVGAAVLFVVIAAWAALLGSI